MKVTMTKSFSPLTFAVAIAICIAIQTLFWNLHQSSTFIIPSLQNENNDIIMTQPTCDKQHDDVVNNKPTKAKPKSYYAYNKEGIMYTAWEQQFYVLSDHGYLKQFEYTGLSTNIDGYNKSQLEQEGTPIPTHAFPYYNNNHRPLPCDPAEEKWWNKTTMDSPSQDGYLMMKPMKVGGSTAAGINLRIARNIAIQRNITSPQLCKVRNEHSVNPRRMMYHARNKSNSVLWTIVREPTNRAISDFFHFLVSREKVEPTNAKFQEYLTTKRNRFQQYYLRVLSMESCDFTKLLYRDPISIANRILKAYDFVAITERLDESAVALQLLLGLETSDVLFVNAKTSGGFDDGMSKNGCTYIVPSFVSTGMKEFFASSYWQSKVFADTYFYQMANQSLDRTIDETIGRKKFEKALQQYRYAQQLVDQECSHSVPMLCNDGGQRNRKSGCLWHDSGCGMECLDRVSAMLKNKSSTIV